MTTFIAVEVAVPSDPGLFADPPSTDVLLCFAVHLAPISPRREVGECLCAFDMWERLPSGGLVHTWTAGGGFVGPEFRHDVCQACADARLALDPSAAVEGTHAHLFAPGPGT